jgi:hypothetical protein
MLKAPGVTRASRWPWRTMPWPATCRLTNSRSCGSRRICEKSRTTVWASARMRATLIAPMPSMSTRLAKPAPRSAERGSSAAKASHTTSRQ